MKLFLALIFAFSSSSALAFNGSDQRVVRETVTKSQPGRGEYARGALYTPSEFAKASEIQMSRYVFNLVARALVGTIDQTTDIMVLVESNSEATSVVKDFARLGGNSSRVHPIAARYDSMWYQDYGPIYSFNADNQLVANDFIYNRYGRVNDDAVPSAVAAAEHTILQKVTMNYEGGNFVSDGRGTCFASTRIYQQNPQLKHEQVDSLMKSNLGCQKLVTLTPLSADITYHIDLFAKMIDDHTFFVGDFLDAPSEKKAMDENAKYLQSLGYTVYRLPVRSTSEENHRTHINSFLINGYVLMPTYGIPEDDESAAIYEKLGYKVLRIQANSFENQGGAIHCVIRSKPQG